MPFPADARTLLYYYEAGPDPKIPGRQVPVGEERCLAFQGPDITRQWEEGGFALRWNPGDGELRPLLRRLGESDVFLERLELVRSDARGVVIDPGIPAGTRYRLYQHGYQSWSLSCVREPGEADEYARLAWKHAMDENPETPHQSALPISLPGHMFPAPGKFHSEQLVGFEEIKGDAGDGEASARMIFYAAGHGGQNVKFRIHLESATGVLREFAVIWDMNGRRFTRHARESLTPVAWVCEKPGEKSARRSFAGLLNETGNTIASNMVRRRSKNEGIIGWCSWYYYYTKITEDIILDNLARLAKLQKTKIDLFQIDDGWQRAIGDWTRTNDKFPGGMQYLAREIKKTGMRAGIWLAPFLVQKDAELLQTHPEVLLRDARDRPIGALWNPNWGGWAYALDVTHPRYREWLADSLTTIVKRWGYDYLKLDFLFTACFRGRWHDDTMAGAGRLRDILSFIRKVVGKDVFLLGCGAPLWPSLGIFDAMRISMDVNHIWSGNYQSFLLRDRNYPTARGALVNTITRSFMHNRFWINDPDCLMVRARNTELSEAQVYLLASVMGLSGGMLLLSDDMTILEPERFAIFEKTVALNRKCAAHTPLPLGLLEGHFPRGLYNPAGFLGIWNPTSGPERVSIPVPGGVDEAAIKNARDFWTGKRIAWQLENGRIRLALAPFESVVAVL